MPVFKPRNFDESDYDESSVESVLKETGLEKHTINGADHELMTPAINGDALPNKDEENQFRSILNKNGASVAQASRTIARLMNSAKWENTQLRAAEMVLDLQGVRDKEGKLTKQAVFNFVINDSTVNLQNIFAPLRTTSSLSEELND